MLSSRDKVSLPGSHVLVTGGSEGIGAAAAEIAAARGARVSLIARDPAKLAAAAARIGHDTETSAADVADPDAVRTAVGRLVERQGPVDVVLSCAGYSHPGYSWEIPLEVYRRQMEVNYLGAVHVVAAVVPSMIERRRGHVSFVSSAAGLIGVYGYASYSPTKFALKGLGETLRAELRPHGIGVSIVYPPDTDTPGFLHENLTKPPETARFSATIAPISAAKMGAAIISGIEEGRLTITADPLTALLARGAGLLGPLVRAMMDRDVRTEQRRRR